MDRICVQLATFSASMLVNVRWLKRMSGTRHGNFFALFYVQRKAELKRRLITKSSDSHLPSIHLREGQVPRLYLPSSCTTVELYKNWHCIAFIPSAFLILCYCLVYVSLQFQKCHNFLHVCKVVDSLI